MFTLQITFPANVFAFNYRLKQFQLIICAHTQNDIKVGIDGCPKGSESDSDRGFPPVSSPPLETKAKGTQQDK